MANLKQKNKLNRRGLWIVALWITITSSLYGDPIPYTQFVKATAVGGANAGGPLLDCSGSTGASIKLLDACSYTGWDRVSLAGSYGPDGAGVEARTWASGGWSGSQNIPEFKLEVDYIGYTGWPFSTVSTGLEMTSFISVEAKPEGLQVATTGIKRAELEVVDSGSITVWDKARPHFGWQTGSYTRRIDLTACPKYLFGCFNPLIPGFPSTSGTQEGGFFSVAASSGYTGPDMVIERTYPITNKENVELRFLSSDLIGDWISFGGGFFLGFRMNVRTTIDVIHFGAPFTHASVNFGQTTTISGIRLFDNEDNDVSTAFIFRDPAGRLIFQESDSGGSEVPEPQLMLVSLIALAFMCCRWRVVDRFTASE